MLISLPRCEFVFGGVFLSLSLCLPLASSPLLPFFSFLDPSLSVIQSLCLAWSLFLPLSLPSLPVSVSAGGACVRAGSRHWLAAPGMHAKEPCKSVKQTYMTLKRDLLMCAYLSG